MKKLYALLMLMIPMISMAQNGGQLNENNALRIDYVRYINGNYEVKIINKQTCNAPVEIIWNSNLDTVVTIPAGQSVTVSLPGAFSTGKIKAQTNTACNGFPSNGNGWVESIVGGTMLPLKYRDFKVTKNGDYLHVSIVPLETTNVKQLNIQISFDGRNYMTVQVVDKDKLVAGQVFTKTILILK